ncbi:hypothetical protein LCI18_003864 [Fusarium solani-melongenae]|uniref:Uncharacterized protein n=1 Tax=Fusarium solani subsp. cucurbitae TaxID=2747967 RepID=A0ACD3YVB4_FUSSC|nr:hypothetical protein LCI18_003864 [Fusarium solani-melongenae]
MSLEDVFPEDPYQPSLQYVASSLIPFNLPWSTSKIRIGTGFHSKLASSDNPFASDSAFDEYSLKSAQLRYRSKTGGTYTHTESSTAAHSRDHMDFSLAASADVAIINVSGQAKFEQNAVKNTDSSLLGRVFAGYIEFEEPPEFSRVAREAVRQGRNSADDPFKTKYGDYYVAGLHIGAANGTELSAASSSDSSSEAKSYSVTVKVKVMCWTATTTKSGSSSQSSSKATGTIKFNGYDTLSISPADESGKDYPSHQRIIGKANSNLEKGKLLQGRLQDVARKFGLVDGALVSQSQVEEILTSGMVIEIQLLPYAKLREYIMYRGRM